MSVTVGTPVSSVMTNKRRVGALKSLGVLTAVSYTHLTLPTTSRV